MTTIHLYDSSDLDPAPLVLEGPDHRVEVTAGTTIGSLSSYFTVDGRQAEDVRTVVDGSFSGRAWAVLDFFGASGTWVEIGAGGSVIGGAAMAIQASHDAQIDTAGEIRSDEGFGITITDPSDAFVSNRGTIFGEVCGVEFSGAGLDGSRATLVNSGTIRAGAGQNDAVSGQGSNQAVHIAAALISVENFGLIAATDAEGSGLHVTSATVDSLAEIANAGEIRSAHAWGLDLSLNLGTVVLDNSGIIRGADGAYLGSAGADTIHNSGTMTGAIELGSGDDAYLGSAGRVNGTVSGGAGDDTLLGGSGADTLLGGTGDDVLDGGGATDHFDGGAGSDTVLYTSLSAAIRVDLPAGRVSFPGTGWSDETLVSIENAEGGSGNDVFIGDGARNTFHGHGGNDTFDGGGNTDTFFGGAGSDTVRYAANTSAVAVDLAAGEARFPGHNWAPESLHSIENAVTGSGADDLVGSDARNRLEGGAGSDTLTGGGDADVLIGGTGADTFRFLAVSDSAPGAADTLLGGGGAPAFQGAGPGGGDRIDLSAIDANLSAAGDQGFSFGTAQGIGCLWAVNSGTDTCIRGNVDGAAGFDFEIVIRDNGVQAGAYSQHDFIL